jgi:hypothetical protein
MLNIVLTRPPEKLWSCTISLVARHVKSFLDTLAASIVGNLASDGQRNSASNNDRNSNSHVRASSSSNYYYNNNANVRASCHLCSLSLSNNSYVRASSHNARGLDASPGAMSQAGRPPIVYHHHMSDKDNSTGRGVLDRLSLPQYTVINASMDIILEYQ